jgi:hypothetical protein
MIPGGPNPSARERLPPFFSLSHLDGSGTETLENPQLSIPVKTSGLDVTKDPTFLNGLAVEF